MLSRALIPLHLREPRHRLAALPEALRSLGVTEAVLLHVSDSPKPLRAAKGGRVREELQTVSDRLMDAGIRTEIEFAHGSPAITITRMTGELGCDLVAFCWKAKSWLQQTLVGNTTLDVVRMSDIPVFVFKQIHEAGVMYATSFHAADSAVIALLNTPRLTSQTLYLLHVGERAPDPIAEAKRSESVRANLERLASECEHHVEILQTQHPNVAKAVVREASRLGVSTIVLGKSKAATGFSSVLGSTAERVAYNATASVLIVPPGAEHNEAR